MEDSHREGGELGRVVFGVDEKGGMMENVALINYEVNNDIQLQRGKFKKTLHKVINPIDEEVGDYLLKSFKRVPDAYKICSFCKTVTLIEVEDTSRLTKEKIYDYSMLYFYLDCIDWSLCLISTDRYGNNRSVIDLFLYYRDNLGVDKT